MKALRGWLFLWLFVASVGLHAHPEWKEASCIGVLDETGRFRLTIKFDVPSYLVGKPSKAATIAELDELMLGVGKLEAAHGVGQKRFATGLRLLADGKELPVTMVSFPAIAEIKGLSLQQGEVDRYPVLLNVKAWAQVPLDTVQLQFAFPAELGSTFVNLRREMTHQVVMSVKPGELGVFIVGEAPAPSGWSRTAGFFSAGFGHVIPEGWDHCLFMAAMLLAAATVTEALKRSLIFTVGHAVTLTLVATGLLPPVGAWIEPVIAATIGYAGWLVYRREAPKAAWLFVPLVFGFIHGLGFAAAAADKLTGWDAAALLPLLVGLNLGIEVAQACIIAASALLLAGLVRLQIPEINLRRFLGLVIAILGFYLTLQRSCASLGMNP